MNCPACNAPDNSKVIDTRPETWGTYRRRECLKCAARWSTEERFVAPKARGLAPWREAWISALRFNDRTAHEMAEILGVSTDIANNRLRILREDGLASVVGTIPPRLGHGRRQNIYRLNA